MKDNITAQFINPEILAKNRRVISGCIKLKDLKSLRDLLAGDLGEVKFEVSFYVDEDHYVVMKGWVKSEIPLTCQRCLQPFLHAVEHDFIISPVNSDVQATNLPDIYEAFLLKDGKLCLDDVIAEELTLAIPIVPKHGSTSCLVVDYK